MRAAHVRAARKLLRADMIRTGPIRDSTVAVAMAPRREEQPGDTMAFFIAARFPPQSPRLARKGRPPGAVAEGVATPRPDPFL